MDTAHESYSLKLNIIELLISISLIVQSCAFAPAGNQQPQVAPTLLPEWTATSIPPTPKPTATSIPSPAPSPTASCLHDGVLAQVKTAVPYEEFTVHHNVIGGVSTLVIWFVDPNLDPDAAAEEIPNVIHRAKQDAVQLIFRLHNSSSCIEKMFDVINTVVVDENYVGWLSTQLPPERVPDGEELKLVEENSLIDELIIAFAREERVQSYVPGSCSWPETRNRLFNHFSRERENVAFYYVIDDFGQNIWAQWDGPADPIMLSLNMGNILLEAECFPPQANIFMIIVDDEGMARFVGVIPKMQTDEMRVIYSE
jgi:hypothetical protein